LSKTIIADPPATPAPARRSWTVRLAAARTRLRALRPARSAAAGDRAGRRALHRRGHPPAEKRPTRNKAATEPTARSSSWTKAKSRPFPANCAVGKIVIPYISDWPVRCRNIPLLNVINIKDRRLICIAYVCFSENLQRGISICVILQQLVMQQSPIT
jgi:hypothetical protein